MNVGIEECAPDRTLVEVTVQVNNVNNTLAKCNEAVSDVGAQHAYRSATPPLTSPIMTRSFFADVAASSFSRFPIKLVR